MQNKNVYGGNAVKTIVKIEAIVLAVILFVGAVLCLLSAGALMWL